jgi:hypothetical protein
MRKVAWGCLLLALGFACGWVASPDRTHYHYRTGEPLMLLEDGVVAVARIPSGTPLLAERRLHDTLDLGWWAYVPVYFETQAHAVDLGIVPGARPESALFRLRAKPYDPSLLPIREPEPVVTSKP